MHSKNQLNITLGCILFRNNHMASFLHSVLTSESGEWVCATMSLRLPAGELGARLLISHVPRWHDIHLQPGAWQRLWSPEPKLTSRREFSNWQRQGQGAPGALDRTGTSSRSTENWHWKLSVWKTQQPLLAAELIIMQIYANKLCLECCWEAAFSR